jgi:hypothetical protein
VVDQVVCMDPRCGEVFADVSHVQAHRKLTHCHVICDVCDLFMLRRQLKMHILLHTGGAHRISFHKSNLDTHIRAVHMETIFSSPHMPLETKPSVMVEFQYQSYFYLFFGSPPLLSRS